MRVVVILAFLWVAGCSHSPVELEFQASATAGQAGYTKGALARTRDDFLGGDANLLTPERLAASADSAPAATAIVLDPGKIAEYRAKPSGFVAVNASTRGKLVGDWAWKAEVGFGHALNRAYLPAGLGVLTDPMNVTFNASVITSELSIARRQELPAGWQAEISGGIGMSWVDADTHIQSSLIELHSRSVQTLPFIAFSTGLTTRKGTKIIEDVRVYKDKSVEIGLGFARPF